MRGERRATVSVKESGLCTLYMVPKTRITVHDVWLPVSDRGELLEGLLDSVNPISFRFTASTPTHPRDSRAGSMSVGHEGFHIPVMYSRKSKFCVESKF